MAYLIEAFENPLRDTNEIMRQRILCTEFNLSEQAVSYDDIPKEILRQLLSEDQIKEIGTQISCYFNFKKPDHDLVLKAPVKSDLEVLVLGGEIDHVTLPANVRKISASMPNAHKIVVKGVGHGVFSLKKCIAKSTLKYLRSKDGSFVNLCEK